MGEVKNFTFTYHISQPAALYDAAQGIQLKRKQLKRDPKRRIHGYQRGVLVRMGILGAIFLAAGVGLTFVPSNFWTQTLVDLCSIGGMACFFCTLTMWISYRRNLKTFLSAKARDGSVVISKGGIGENSYHGPYDSIKWSDYDGCIVGDRIIVVLAKKQGLFMYPYSDEIYATLKTGLEAFGKGDTIYRRKG